MPKEELGKEFLNLVCKVCGGRYKTCQHHEYKYKEEDWGKYGMLNEIKCEICGGKHKISEHKLAMGLLKQGGKGRKTGFAIDARTLEMGAEIERKRSELERRLSEISRRALRFFEATGEIQPSIERAARETQERE
jgi:hypothetical protein